MDLTQERGSCYETDAHGVLGVFFNKPVHDPKASEVEGRPVYNPVPYVKIIVPGDPLSQVIRAVNENDKGRWPKAWQAFRDQREGLADGTPIEAFPVLTAVQVAELKHQQIITVEQLAGVADSNLKKIGQNGRELRERARQFMQGSGDTERELRRQIEAQAQKIADLEARLRTAGALPIKTDQKAA